MRQCSFASSGAEPCSEVRVHLKSDTEADPYGQKFTRGLLGVTPTTGVSNRLPIYEAVPESVRYTILITRSMVDGLVQIVSGQRATEDVGGPIKIAQIAGQQAALGALPLFSYSRCFQLISDLSTCCQSRCWMEDICFSMQWKPSAVGLLVPALSIGHFEAGSRSSWLWWCSRRSTILGSIGLWDQLQRLIG